MATEEIFNPCYSEVYLQNGEIKGHTVGCGCCGSDVKLSRQDLMNLEKDLEDALLWVREVLQMTA